MSNSGCCRGSALDLDSCIGCGCLSLKVCALYNPEDGAADLGDGPRYLLGNTSSEVIGQ